jgi:aspartate carbamoyltransferase catalytic subunit
MGGLIGLRGVDRGHLDDLLDRGEVYAKQVASREPPSAELDGRIVATAFFEPSTRTRLSFEVAATHVGARVMTFTPETSSTAKGESLKDTMLTLAAIGADVLVVRHGARGVPALAEHWTGLPVVNAGDGRGEHPTQALADALTLRQHFGSVSGLRMGIVGDVRNSRVARSLLWSLPTLGVEIVLVGPSPLLPEANPWDAEVSTELDPVLPGLDVVYMLRMQLERGAAAGLPGLTGYPARYGLDDERMERLAADAVVMHPGPMNRGVELGQRAADGPRSLILDQVRNGVPMRMAVLADCMGHE